MSSHISPLLEDKPCLSVEIYEGECLTEDQGEMLETELVEISDVEFSHLQYLIQSQLETQAALPDDLETESSSAADIMKDTPESAAVSPFSQAMDLSTSTEEHGLVMPGEKTPTSFGEVPGYVLARGRLEDISTDADTSSSSSSQKHSRPGSRVCLETRFNAVSPDIPTQLNIQSAVRSNFLTIFQQSAEAQGGAMHPQMQMQMTSSADRANPYDVPGPFVGSVGNRVTKSCKQGVRHTPCRILPKHQGLIFPNSFSFNFRSGAEAQQLVNKENHVFMTSAAARNHCVVPSFHLRKDAQAVGSGSSIKRKTQAHISLSQRREKHNNQERERRMKIRQCCDELKTLVPFCGSDTDKVTTLLWTTTYLKYINRTCGDTVKEEFKREFTDKSGNVVKPSLSSSPDPVQRETDETLTTPLVVEQ